MGVLLRSVLVFGLLALGAAVPSRADVVTLKFDDFQDGEQILDYYNGGSGSLGSGGGPNYGITFGAAALAYNDGLNANFANNPSAPGVLYFGTDVGAVMDVAGGFTAGLSFYYSTSNPRFPQSVQVYDGLDGTGNVLASIDLPLTPTLPPPGAPDLNNWKAVGLHFVGDAKSVKFSGEAGYIAFDNMTLGVAPVPEPSSLVLAGLGCLGVLGRLARRRVVTA